jgi:hypothetical protein
MRYAAVLFWFDGHGRSLVAKFAMPHIVLIQSVVVCLGGGACIDDLVSIPASTGYSYQEGCHGNVPQLHRMSQPVCEAAARSACKQLALHAS